MNPDPLNNPAVQRAIAMAFINGAALATSACALLIALVKWYNQ